MQQSLSGSTAGLHEGQMQLFRMQMAAAVKQEKILEKYIHFEQSHGNFFSTIEELVHRAGKAVRQLLRESTFNEKTGAIHLPTGYGRSLKDLKKSLAKARGIDPKMEKKLKGYTVYAVVVPGAKDKATVTWFIEKDGVVVREAELQNYLEHAGKYLDPSDYYVIPYEVLTKKINDSWKQGIDYLSGKEYSGLIKGTVSASAYAEDWVERFNKSEFGQAVLGLGLSMAAIRYRPVVKKVSGVNIAKPNAGVVQSRINVANGPTRFSSSGNAGFNHVLDRHFNPNRNAGQFTISQDKLKNILSSKNTVSIPVKEIPGNQFERIVDIGETAGTIKPSIPDVGGTPTNYIRVITDKAGNLITTYPIPRP
ncbi:hypothetical protein [Listeria grayi]|uniref:hypothetical protein n=1 Tax=Listeria grayi TaxID=1641 RepID=UPI001F32A9D3|nr:hypothetical protein [Listeria grayi]